MKRVKSFLKKLLKGIPKDYKKRLPLVYAVLVIFSIVLFLSISVFPQLIYCPKMFGVNVCLPIGAYILFVINFPGYFIAGNILKISPQSSTYFSMLVVAAISLATYALIGYFIDKIKERRLKSEQLTKYLIVFMFVVLVLLVLYWR